MIAVSGDRIFSPPALRRMLLLAATLFSCTMAAATGDSLRILSLSAAATHILTTFGSPPAAIDQYGLIAAGDNPPPVLGRGSAVSSEKMTELGINCVILWYYQSDAEQLFRGRGLRVMRLQPVRLHNYPELVTRLGELTGRTAQAEELRTKFSELLYSLTRQQPPARPARVYFELYTEWKAAGTQSYAGDLLRAAGGLCPAEKTSLLSAESVLEFAPEVIFFVEGSGQAGEIVGRPGLEATPAARSGRIHPVDRRLLTEGLAIIQAIGFFRQKIDEAR